VCLSLGAVALLVKQNAVRGMTVSSRLGHRRIGRRKPLMVIATLSALALAACGGSSSPSAHGTTPTSQPRTPRTAKPLIATTTSPTPPAPISSTPAPGCFPRTQKGVCFGVGDACPPVDHGRKGEAADGAPIACRDTDGWRWRAA
jgi:hypothetical protein